MLTGRQDVAEVVAVGRGSGPANASRRARVWLMAQATSARSCRSSRLLACGVTAMPSPISAMRRLSGMCCPLGLPAPLGRRSAPPGPGARLVADRARAAEEDELLEAVADEAEAVGERIEDGLDRGCRLLRVPGMGTITPERRYRPFVCQPCAASSAFLHNGMLSRARKPAARGVDALAHLDGLLGGPDAAGQRAARAP